MRRRSFLFGLFKTLALPSLARAVELIDFLSQRLKKINPKILIPSDLGFQNLKTLFNKDLVLDNPNGILQSGSVAEFQALMTTSVAKELKWRVRSGGHSFAGFSMGSGLVYDTRLLKTVEAQGSELKLGSGLTLKETQDGLAPLGFCIPNGSCPTVGLGGFLLGGGHSLKSRHWGLGADRVTAMDVVLASGENLRVTPTNHAELYWALLGGGGGNFALVENFYINPIRSHQELVFNLKFSPSQAEEVFNYWQDLSHIGSTDMSVVFILHFRAGKIQQLRLHGVFNDVSPGDSADLFATSPWGDLQNLSPLAKKIETRSSNWMRQAGEAYGFKGTSHFADEELEANEFRSLLAMAQSRTQNSAMSLIFEPMGGLIKQPTFANAYPHRQARYIVEVHSVLSQSSKSKVYKQNLNGLHKDMDPLFSGRAYINYPDLNLKDWATRYYGDHLHDLVAIKKRYDPHNRFDYGDQSLSQWIRDHDHL